VFVSIGVFLVVL